MEWRQLCVRFDWQQKVYACVRSETLMSKLGAIGLVLVRSPQRSLSRGIHTTAVRTESERYECTRPVLDPRLPPPPPPLFITLLNHHHRMATKIVYDLVQASDIDRAFEIETQGFPEDEAASLESLQSVSSLRGPLPRELLGLTPPAHRYRQRHAGDYFLGAYEVDSSSPDDGSSRRRRRLLIGYTCATLTRQPTLTHEAMSTHEPEGTHVAIHSVCVATSHRHRGIASALLREYLARLDDAGQAQQQQQSSTRPRIESALLIAHPELVPLYERAGFTVVGPSAVVHGAKPWVELKRELSRPDASSAFSSAGSSSTPRTDAPPAAEAEEEEGEVRSPGRLLGYFEGGMADLVDPKDGTNKVNLYCPRAECRCLLLRAGAGTWVQGTTKHDIEVRFLLPPSLLCFFPFRGAFFPPQQSRLGPHPCMTLTLFA